MAASSQKWLEKNVLGAESGETERNRAGANLSIGVFSLIAISKAKRKGFP
jgi:hypothetical protein